VKGDVELAERNLGAGELADAPAQPLRERHAARVDADQRQPRQVRVPLNDLVCDPGEGPLDRLGIEDGLCCRGLRAQDALRAGLTLRLLSGLSGPS
jgi:hypothetical protein